MTSSTRRDELDANLRRVKDQIAEAAVGAGRDPAEVSLIVVTKTFPASDIRLLYDLGVRDIGENRHPEAGDKATELRDLAIVWHFLGQVQSNKAARIASYADVVHSVDSVKLARRLGTAAAGEGRVVTCLVQASLDPPERAEGRGGAAMSDVAAVADGIAATAGVRLGGVMGVAPLGEPAENAFRRLADVWRSVLRVHPEAAILSAGMSGDFPAAIRAGATHVRVGSAVVGSRALLG